MEMMQLEQGRSLSWQEYGKSTGYPVFYFHGLPGSRVEAESADAAARELGVRIIAVDRFGYGDSRSADGFGFFKFSDALAQLAQALKLNTFSLLGFSGGVPYALACAFNLGKQIDKIAIVASPAEFSTPVMKAHYNPQSIPLFELAAADTELARQQIEPLAQSPEATLQYMLSNISTDDQRLFSQARYHDSYAKNMTVALNQGAEGTVCDLNQLGLPWPFDVRALRLPVSIWHGEEDPICGAAIADYLADTISGSCLHILHGKGHFFLFEHWHEVLSDLVNENETADARTVEIIP
jgi:pimeloyl-ACP methyl ester carboxylesterase